MPPDRYSERIKGSDQTFAEQVSERMRLAEELVKAVRDRHVRLVPETPYGANVIERLKGSGPPDGYRFDGWMGEWVPEDG